MWKYVGEAHSTFLSNVNVSMCFCHILSSDFLLLFHDCRWCLLWSISELNGMESSSITTCKSQLPFLSDVTVFLITDSQCNQTPKNWHSSDLYSHCFSNSWKSLCSLSACSISASNFSGQRLFWDKTCCSASTLGKTGYASLLLWCQNDCHWSDLTTPSTINIPVRSRTWWLPFSTDYVTPGPKIPQSTNVSSGPEPRRD